MLNNTFAKNKQQQGCDLCARHCFVQREKGLTGYCNQTSEITAARAALHFWEEPVISGTRGSGAVFFSGCSLKCDFCQNYDISRGFGKKISVNRLEEIFFELKEQGAHNINLVTPTHFTPQILQALNRARHNGLELPIVWNTSSYESAHAMDLIEESGSVDIFLADAKFFSPEISAAYCHAQDYFEVCLSAIKRMHAISPQNLFDENSLMKKGVIIRILLMPGCLSDAKSLIRALFDEFGNGVYYSLMNQYTPIANIDPLSPLAKKVSEEDYEKLISYALSLGVENGFIQQGETADESFIPPFDLTGI